MLSVSVGLDISYCEGQTTLYVRVAAFRFCIFPRKSKQDKVKKEKTTKTKKQFPDFTKEEVLDGIELAVRSVKKLKFRLHKLKFHFISAFEDPYQTAMIYGYANAAVHAFALPQNRRADVSLGVDFEQENYYLDGYLSVTIRIYYIMKLVCCVVCGAIPILWGRRKRLKGNNKNVVKGKGA